MTILAGAPRTSREGLFERVIAMLDMVRSIPDDLSDEESEGVIALMPPDVAETLEGFLNPRVRRASIAYLKMIGKWMDEAREAKETGKKVILVPFNFVPELIHAFENAVPLTSEVLTSLGAGAIEGKGHRYWDYAMGLGIPDHLCSSSTIELGSMLTGQDFEADAIVSSTAGACDANSKIHEFVSHYLGIPQFILEKPVDDTERGREQFRRNFYRLVSNLEEYIGEEISEERLRDVVENCNRAAELHYQLWELKKNVPCPVPNLFSFFVYGCRFTMWGRPEAVRCMEVMVEESRRRLEAGEYPAPRELARVGWLYVGYYIDYNGLFNWMEEQGYSYLFDVLDLFFPDPIPTDSRETMLDGVCEAARRFPMTRQMGADSMSVAWIDDAVHMCREMNANCGIYCGHHACKQTWSVISIVQKELMDRIGAPTLCLQGDAWLSGMTPMSRLQGDIDEFMKNVVIKRRRVHRPLR
ncbi:MAG: 2-hydroxyacyl-CoA dehydratase family protein [Actinobacteria bacterium]|nr:2-hydroxyacyl-CoA dehydratase family protein [Actinomycetota bacterium]MBU1943656.1 2-hydroxyacyl-CoA dehydratase family protein [Actinomycetota bacterium]